MTGLASAWAMARQRPKEDRRKLDAAMRCSTAYAPISDMYVYKDLDVWVRRQVRVDLIVMLCHEYAINWGRQGRHE